MTQALRPDFLIKNMPTMQPIRGDDGPTEEERLLAAMTLSSGWIRFVAFKDELIQDMNKANKAAIAQGLSFEQIGQNTIITNMAIDIIDRLFNKVSDAVEVVEQNGNK
jgi:hypothetical protein